LFGYKGYHKAEAEAVELAKYWLDRIRLLDKADMDAGNLSYGDQRRLEIVRAMCTEPVLLCLDEPAAGLNPRESHELNTLLHYICDRPEIGVLLIEHDMSVVMEISDHVIVLDYGRMISDGTPEQVRADPAVIRAYLGEEDLEELPEVVAADLDGIVGRDDGT
ncbi:MAG TPA: ATP-binding cassette domain-containing protein, partial [Kiloniellales bacterium]|nr:ATP-binding cassette domain-containing protein [Kiloniellales bacterium]